MVDRRYINTLYVTSEGSYVHKDGANVVVDVDGAQRMRVPVHMLGSIACFGRVSLSPAFGRSSLGIAIVCHQNGIERLCARIVTAMISLDTRKAVPLPQALHDAIESYRQRTTEGSS